MQQAAAEENQRIGAGQQTQSERNLSSSTVSPQFSIAAWASSHVPRFSNSRPHPPSSPSLSSPRAPPLPTRSLPVITFRRAPKAAASHCSICLAKFKGFNRCVLLSCTHIFHERCLHEWLNSSVVLHPDLPPTVSLAAVRTCPVCRQPIAGGTKSDFNSRQGTQI
jgi:hypothetical protein